MGVSKDASWSSLIAIKTILAASEHQTLPYQLWAWLKYTMCLVVAVKVRNRRHENPATCEPPNSACPSCRAITNQGEKTWVQDVR